MVLENIRLPWRVAAKKGSNDSPPRAAGLVRVVGSVLRHRRPQRSAAPIGRSRAGVENPSFEDGCVQTAAVRRPIVEGGGLWKRSRFRDTADGAENAAVRLQVRIPAGLQDYLGSPLAKHASGAVSQGSFDSFEIAQIGRAAPGAFASADDRNRPGLSNSSSGGTGHVRPGVKLSTSARAVLPIAQFLRLPWLSPARQRPDMWLA